MRSKNYWLNEAESFYFWKKNNILFVLVLRNAFTAFESPEKKGVITVGDLATIVEMLGHRMDDRQQKQAIREADPGNTGELNFEQFAVYASRYVEVEEDLDAIAKELREAFLLYDRDGMSTAALHILQYFNLSLI